MRQLASGVSFQAALKVLLLSLTLFILRLQVTWLDLDGDGAGFDLSIIGVNAAWSAPRIALVSSLDSYASGPVMFNSSALPSCARHIVINLYSNQTSANITESSADEGGNNATAQSRPSCQAILLRDDSALTSRECAEGTLGAYLPAVGGIQPGVLPASIATTSPQTADTSPLAIVRIEMLPYMHHHQSGRPRMYAFLSVGRNDIDQGDYQGIHCTGIRPIVRAIPIDGHLVSVASSRKALSQLLWEDADLSESTSSIRTNTHNAPLMFDSESRPHYWWVKWRTARELDQRHHWIMRYIGRPGSVFIHDWDDPGSLLEAEDPNPRGHRIHYCLKRQFKIWREARPFSGEPFFEWLDYGTGRRRIAAMQKENLNDKRKRNKCIEGLDRRFVKFLTKEEAEQYRVEIRRSSDGHNYIRWKESKELLPKMDKHLLFVWDINKQLYAFVEDRDAPERLAHTSITTAGPLLAAGELIVGRNGRLKVVDFSSGHYKPKYEHFLQMFKWFQERGYAVGREFVQWEGHDFPSDDFKEVLDNVID